MFLQKLGPRRNYPGVAPGKEVEERREKKLVIWFKERIGHIREGRREGRMTNCERRTCLRGWQRSAPAPHRPLDRTGPLGAYTVITTNARAPKQWWVPDGSVHFSKAQNRGAGPERSQAFSLCPTINSPKHHYKIGLLKTINPKHHKTITALHLIKDCLLTLVLRAFDDPFSRQNCQWPHQAFRHTCLLWTLQYVPTIQSWSQATT